MTATPGTDGVHDFLSDSFTLPVGARHPVAARDWLLEAGSTEGEDLFNPLNGAVPARIDADPTPYTGYLAWALQQWRSYATRRPGTTAATANPTPPALPAAPTAGPTTSSTP